jgi:hypothetical protein
MYQAVKTVNDDPRRQDATMLKVGAKAVASHEG